MSLGNARRSIAALALFALSFSAAHTQQRPPQGQPSFEVAVVRPNPTALRESGWWTQPNIGSFKASGVSLVTLIRLAYGIDVKQIVNQPKWLDTNLYDVSAKPEAGIKLSRAELQPRLQNLLQQRFHLVVHRETRDVAGYALVVAKHGSKLHPTEQADLKGLQSEVHRGRIMGLNWTVDTLARSITSVIDKPVVNRAAIPGSYDVDINYAPDDTVNSDLPSLFTAIDETLGLRLLPTKVPAEFLVIDSVDAEPTPN